MKSIFCALMFLTVAFATEKEKTDEVLDGGSSVKKPTQVVVEKTGNQSEIILLDEQKKSPKALLTDEKVDPLKPVTPVVLSVEDQYDALLTELDDKEKTCWSFVKKVIIKVDGGCSIVCQYVGLAMTAIPSAFSDYIPQPYNKIVSLVGVGVTGAATLFTNLVYYLDPNEPLRNQILKMKRDYIEKKAKTLDDVVTQNPVERK